MDFDAFDLLVVGSGFYGATIAERAATELGLNVCIIERRHHVGGNSYSERERETGIEYHKYGSHIFHTSNANVWNYLHKFTTFNDYRHRVQAKVGDRFYSMPVNLSTICAFFDRAFTPDEAKNFIAEQAQQYRNADPRNLEEKAISLIGRPLYDAFIRGYTLKQWQTDPTVLPPDIITRLPVRFTFNDRYFSDTFEGIPEDGYARVFERMLQHPKIEVCNGVDFFELDIKPHAKQLLVYTGPIDRYFNYVAGALGWRTIDLEMEIVRTGDFQGISVVNYPDEDISYTRIHEFKHFHPERQYPTDKTVICREYSRFAGRSDEPYYPINTTRDQQVYDTYRVMARNTKNVLFGGRLGTYRYLDMHQAIGAALKTFELQVKSFFDNRTMPAELA